MGAPGMPGTTANDVVELMLLPDEESRWEHEPKEFSNFVKNMAKTFLGFESAREEYRSIGDELPDIDDMDEWAEEMIDGQVRSDEFGFRLEDAIHEGCLTKVKGFDSLLGLAARKANWEGSPKKFEHLLKRSSIFSHLAFDIITRTDI